MKKKLRNSQTGGKKINPRDYMFAYAHTHTFRANKLVQDKGSIYKN